jgi:hypothetical protein
MEKVKIKTCIDKGTKTKDGNPVIEIELEDGRKGSAFDSLFLGLPLNQEVEFEIKPAKDYNNEKRFYFLLPGQNTKKGFQKDWSFEKRKISLECSINAIKSTGKEVQTKNILALADEFFEYLNKK